MRLRRNNAILEIMTICLFAAAAWAITVSANAAGPAESASSDSAPLAALGKYEVENGDSLGAIAIAHGIRLQDLVEANEIDDPDKINAGTELIIPGDPKNGVLTRRGVRLKVPRGITLSRIAELYGVSVRQIVRANRIADPDRLRAGQKLLIPGAEKVVELIPPPPCYKDPVEIWRLHTQETHEIPLCYCDGRPNEKTLDVLSNMSGPVRKPVPFQLHPRLLQLLQKVADKYPGKRIEIISGQRTRKNPGHESYHNKGQALDFRVAGVSNRELSRFVRRLRNVGVGYYPNSVFIHMDTRDYNAYWIDYSRPGEKAIYGKANMSTAQIEAIREKRRAKKAAGAKARDRSEETVAVVATKDSEEEAQAVVESESDAEVEAVTPPEEVAEATVATEPKGDDPA